MQEIRGELDHVSCCVLLLGICGIVYLRRVILVFFWISPKDCMPLMTEKFEVLGRETRPKQCYGLFGQNEIAEHWKMGAEREEVWVTFWASISPEFRDISLSNIILDWKAAVS